MRPLWLEPSHAEPRRATPSRKSLPPALLPAAHCRAEYRPVEQPSPAAPSRGSRPPSILCANRSSTHSSPLQHKLVRWRRCTGAAVVLCSTALEQRIIQRRWGQGGSTIPFQQEAELKDLRATFPEYVAIYSRVPQDVLARLDQTYEAFCRRVQAGEKPGFPRVQGRGRYHSFTCKEYGRGAYLGSGQEWALGPVQG